MRNIISQIEPMEMFNFISSMTAHLAWPLTALFIVLLLRKQLIALFSRIASVKHGDTELQFSKGSEIIIKKEPTPEEKEKIRIQQVVTTRKWETGYYTLYSNGVLVQRVRILVRAGQSETHATFAITFPNEVTSIQFVGGEQYLVVKISASWVLIGHPVSRDDRQVDLIISGL